MATTRWREWLRVVFPVDEEERQSAAALNVTVTGKAPGDQRILLESITDDTDWPISIDIDETSLLESLSIRHAALVTGIEFPIPAGQKQTVRKRLGNTITRTNTRIHTFIQSDATQAAYVFRVFLYRPERGYSIFYITRRSAALKGLALEEEHRRTRNWSKVRTAAIMRAVADTLRSPPDDEDRVRSEELRLAAKLDPKGQLATIDDTPSDSHENVPQDVEEGISERTLFENAIRKLAWEDRLALLLGNSGMDTLDVAQLLNLSVREVLQAVERAAPQFVRAVVSVLREGYEEA